MKNLYLVTCSEVTGQAICVYVISPDLMGAEKKALTAMQEIGYKYILRVDEIVLVATTTAGGANFLLVD